jgi:ribonuclease HI
MKGQKDKVGEVIRIYTDGSGCRPDGKGSGFAWLRQDTGERKITRENGLTNNQAEYRAILAALEPLPKGATAEILTDSENTCFQLKGQRRTLDPKLAELNEKIRMLGKAKNLSVAFLWIPRRENLAGKLL